MFSALHAFCSPCAALPNTFEVEGNQPPSNFDVAEFEKRQQRANAIANEIVRKLRYIWDLWESGKLDDCDTCKQMCTDLGRFRNLLEQHPRLDRGRWWAQLGGYYMNVHKLLENTLFECELYLGYALTFGDSEVRWLAEQNLKGCYQKGFWRRFSSCGSVVWSR